MRAGASRSWLFVPADSDRKLAKGLGSGADVLILDLEDAVAPERKDTARLSAAAFIQAQDPSAGPRIYVRINALDTGLALQDLAAVVQPGLDGILMPKVREGADLQRVGHYIEALSIRAAMDPAGVKIAPVATETPQALLLAHTFLKHAERVAAVTWGAEDLSAAVGATAKTDADGVLSPLYAQAESMCLLLANSIGATALDTVYTDFRDAAGLRTASLRSRRRGFRGRIAIHPDQVPVINEAYAPSAEELAMARRIVAAFEQSPAVGTVGIDGLMYDRPHYVQAMAVLRDAQ